MSDPSISFDVLDYIQNIIKINEENRYYNVIKNYIEEVIKKSKELKWAEFEYCIVFPFVVLGINNPKVMIKFPKIGDNLKVKEYILTLTDSIKKYFEKKILFLPLSTPKYVLLELTEELNKNKEWLDIVDEICVDVLPTNKCNDILRNFISLFPSNAINTQKYITLTEKFCKERIDSKKVTAKLFKQNSRSLVAMFEIKRKDANEETTIQEQFDQSTAPTKRERKICLIRIDYDTITNGIEGQKKETKKVSTQNNRQSSTQPQENNFPESGKSIWKQQNTDFNDSSLPSRPIEQRIEGEDFHEGQNPFQAVSYPSYSVTNETQRHLNPFHRTNDPTTQEATLRECPILLDYDFKRYYSAQTFQSGREQQMRLQRIDTQIFYSRQEQPMEMCNERDVKLSLTCQPSLFDLLY